MNLSVLETLRFRNPPSRRTRTIGPPSGGPIMQQPEIYLNAVGDAFDADGNLVKDSLKGVLQAYIDAFAAHVAKHHG